MVTKKAQALAREIADELKLRTSLTVSEDVDTDGNPLVVAGAASAGSPGARIRVVPQDWPLGKDILGLDQRVLTPHKIQIAFETNGTGEDVNDWTSWLPIVGCCVLKGTKVEIYESANGDNPDTADIDSTNLKASFNPSLTYGMIANQ